jgi:hypothetical protein
MVRIEQVSIDGRRLSTSAADVTVAYVVTLAPDSDDTAILGAISTMGPQFMSTLNQGLDDQGLNYVVEGVEVGTAVVEVVALASTSTTTTTGNALGDSGDTKSGSGLLIGLVVFGVIFCIMVSMCIVCYSRVRKNSQGNS